LEDKRVAARFSAGDTPRHLLCALTKRTNALATLEFFFDCSSPWTYLAFSRIEALAERTGAEIDWRPILVGGVFNAVNESVYEARANPHPVKGRYYVKDLQDWARYCGIEIGRPPVFPVRSVDAMRAAIVALDEGKLPAFSWATFRAYWGALRDISQPDVLEDICGSVGLDWDMVSERIKADDVKARLRTNTEEVIARGGFGSPTMFVNKTDMYFGNDRLPLVEAALAHG
jgi:2-hydroxychromene-2-carboxylate isomerase